MEGWPLFLEEEEETNFVSSEVISLGVCKSLWLVGLTWNSEELF